MQAYNTVQHRQAIQFDQAGGNGTSSHLLRGIQWGLPRHGALTHAAFCRLKRQLGGQAMRSQKFPRWLGGCFITLAATAFHRNRVPPDWVSDRSSFTGREIRSGIQNFPRLRHDRAALCPQTVECAENSDGPQTRCCFRDEYNKDIAELLWDGSKHFHALKQLRGQHECIVTEQGKMSHRKTIGGSGGVRGKLACGTTDGVRSKGRETGSLGQCGSVDRAGLMRLPYFFFSAASTDVFATCEASLTL